MASVHPIPLSGVYAAAVTPLTILGQPDLAALPDLLSFLAQRGCHGALLLGTTGEGPSFSPDERAAIWQAAAEWRSNVGPGFRLLAGTGSPSLSETISLTKIAFELGCEAVCVLPPFFFRDSTEDGLFNWFAQVMEQSVPEGRQLLGYHIPAVSGVALPLSLLQRLNAAFPTRFGGLKDSSGNLESARDFAAGLPDKAVLVGNDRLLAPGLASGAAGCITAGANLWSPLLRAIYDAHQRGEDTETLQREVDSLREKMDAAPPAPAYIKALLHAQNGFPLWPVRAPLLDFSPEQTQSALTEELRQTSHEKM
ncbi:MAG: dihydrodipicolinate synthase family protein [Chloroflexi bacterium]|nr:dihydrodipicolinate synthase family protein [Chloroflexota bacterium]